MEPTPVYWEHELENRDSLIDYFTRNLRLELTKMNSAFRFVRIESPILVDDTLRSDMTAPACTTLLNGIPLGKYRLPLVIWQHGKVFFHWDNYVEFYSLQYNIIFSKTTGMAYLPTIMQNISTMIGKQCGPTISTSENGIETISSASSEKLLVSIQEREIEVLGKSIEIKFDMDNCIVQAWANDHLTDASTLW